MKKRHKRVWVFIFFFFFLIPQVFYQLCGGYIDSKNYEKRELAERPKLSLSSVTKYPAEFESYYNDALPFRTQIIVANSLMDYYCFQESSVSKVICGKKDWLFYNPRGNDGDPIGDLTGETFCTSEELDAMTKNLVKMNDYLESKGREFVIMINPNKETIYGEKYLPEISAANYSYTKADQVVSYLKEHSNLRVVYSKEAIQTAMSEFQEYDFYYSTDTHWNALGAYAATQCLLGELGYKLPPLRDAEIKHISPADGGDLANMMSLSKFIMEKNSYSVEFESDINVTDVSNKAFDEYRYVSDSPNTKKILIVRDSFGSAMAPYIGGLFKESYMPHRRDYLAAMIEEEQPDIVVYEVVERYVDVLSTFNAVP